MTAASDAATLAGIDRDLVAIVDHFGIDGLEARDSADAFVRRTEATLWRVMAAAFGLILVVGTTLERAVIPSLKRGVAIAEAIARGTLDGLIVSRGRSEAAQLLRALATMQQAIAQSAAQTQSLHDAEARQQRLFAAELRTALNRLRDLSDSTFEGLLIHRDGAVLDANAAFCSMVGMPLSDVIGAPFELFAGDAAPLLAVSVAGRPEVSEILVAASGDAMLPVEVRSREIAYDGGTARVTALRDLRERHEAEDRMRFMACHDGLTGLANRFLLRQTLERALVEPPPAPEPIAVLYIDLDRFKTVNDSLGHDAGDLLLKQVAARLIQNTRASDITARIGGDEFIVVQVPANHPCSAENLACRLIERLSEPYDIADRRVCIGASIGVAVQTAPGDQAETLIKNADLALYRAKLSGRGVACFFDPGMELEQTRRREAEAELAAAVEAGRMELDYQPLFAAVGGEITGFEALVRWPHPTRGRIPPGEFIPMAEETGLIVPLGAWVLEAACRAASRWAGRARVAVNVSARQFKSGRLPQTVAAALSRAGLEPDRLELEVTESLLIDDSDRALEILRELKSLGLRIVLDDFGTGYSSLSYLRRFPFDKVKIDKSFINDVCHDQGAHAIVAAILAMCNKFGLEVTAEGIETEHQLALLRSAGCDQIQGFLLGRPMSEAAARALLDTMASRPLPVSHPASAMALTR